jgi:hypothetical protein
MVFYCNRQIVTSQRQHQAGLDYCTAKISVEHGMGGFRRFLQRGFFLGLLIGKGRKQSFSWHSRAYRLFSFQFGKNDRGDLALVSGLSTRKSWIPYSKRLSSFLFISSCIPLQVLADGCPGILS